MFQLLHFHPEFEGGVLVYQGRPIYIEGPYDPCGLYIKSRGNEKLVVFLHSTGIGASVGSPLLATSPFAALPAPFGYFAKKTFSFLIIATQPISSTP
jgi:hypothetical protein